MWSKSAVAKFWHCLRNAWCNKFDQLLTICHFSCKFFVVLIAKYLSFWLTIFVISVAEYCQFQLHVHNIFQFNSNKFVIQEAVYLLFQLQNHNLSWNIFVLEVTIFSNNLQQPRQHQLLPDIHF